MSSTEPTTRYRLFIVILNRDEIVHEPNGDRMSIFSGAAACFLMKSYLEKIGSRNPLECVSASLRTDARRLRASIEGVNPNGGVVNPKLKCHPNAQSRNVTFLL